MNTYNNTFSFPAVAPQLPQFKADWHDLAVETIGNKTYAVFYLVSGSAWALMKAEVVNKTIETWYSNPKSSSPDDDIEVSYDGWKLNPANLATVIDADEVILTHNMTLSIEPQANDIEQYLDEHAQYLFELDIKNYEPDYEL